MQGHNYQTEAIVIKKTKLGEADRILTLFTPDLGKIQAVAKGVRKPKSKMAGHLELLTHSQLVLAKGHNLDTITACQTINGFLPLKNDLDLTSYALYVTELAEQFTIEDQENRQLFELLRDTLQRLCEANNRDMVLHHYEMQLLDQAGYRPELRRCLDCQKPLEPVTNYFSYSEGGVICPNCRVSRPFARPLSVNALKVMRLLQDNDTITAFKLKISSSLAEELEDIIRRYVKYLLEKDVKSTAWMDSLKTHNP